MQYSTFNSLRLKNAKLNFKTASTKQASKLFFVIYLYIYIYFHDN